MTTLRDRFRAPGPLFFPLMMIPDPGVASVLGSSGADFVILDAEHGPYTPESIKACVEALASAPASVLVRTPSADTAEIEAAMSAGADGVLAPHVETAEDTAAVVQAARRTAGENATVMVIIESRLGVDNAAEIAAVEGLDGIMVGPADLAEDLGIKGQLSHENVRAAIDRVVECSLAAGIKVSPWREPVSAAERDSSMVLAFGDKGALAGAAGAAVAQARERGTGPSLADLSRPAS